MAPSRRTFLKSSAAVAAVALANPRAHAFSNGQPAITPPLSQFGYGDVTLLEGPVREQFDRNHAFYRGLNEDSLLKPFRQRAGLPAPGDDMGGWYSWAPLADLDKPGNNGFAPCHSFGQYLSALSRYYAATGDRATKEKVDRIVRNFAPAITPHFWDDHRFPAYTYDKISCGMIDAHQFAGNATAFKAMDATLDSVAKYLPPTALSRAEQYARPHKDESFCWDEPYTLPENAFLAWQRGAGDRYRQLGVRFLADSWYWDPLAAGENVLPGKHAYSHVNAMSSAMQAYFVLGSEKHLHAAKNGFDFLRTTQSFATGGWGPDEDFRAPGSGEVGESLTKTHSSFETPCGSYAHFKITRYLLRATSDSRYGDSMEQVLYNCILGALPIKEDGHGFYYSDYNHDGSKFYHPYKWHCCTGTFSQVAADYGISAYFHDGDGVYVNLFVPSRVKWNRAGGSIALVQKTNYPLTPATEIAVETDRQAGFPVYLRIPAWAGPKTRIAVNGKRVDQSLEPGRFAKLQRTWKNGDRIEVELDMPTHVEPVDPQNPNLIAVVHGPLALFAMGELPAAVRRQDLMQVAQVASGSTDWQAKTDAGTLSFRPFTAIHDEHYRLYLNVQA
ncbi:MAG TPA: beta-L-arabinofuranosidase domain-containing protein [Terracidiphilus sp.]|nr:beta-L-arabinofuranosidase domain-containing protein [Terracidiphilus sp.]